MTDKPAESAVERWTEYRRSLDARFANPNCNDIVYGEMSCAEHYADAALAELKAENEALRCCGNCGHYEPHHDPYGDCEQQCDALGGDHEYPDGYKHDGKPLVWVDSWDHCHWKVSRWTERGRE